MKNILIGFDFSINKPACTIVYNNKFYFFIWPISLPKTDENIYHICTDVQMYNRNLKSISKKSKVSSSDMTLEHTKRSVELADKILKDISELVNRIIIQDGRENVYLCSEGLSFSSKGNSALDLATYKGVLYAELYKELKPDKVLTFAPISIKAIAHCSSKDKVGDKNAMIQAFISENLKSSCFWRLVKDGTLKGNKNYRHCVDDLVDSYFAVKTMYKKLELTGVDIWDNQDQ